MDFDLEQRTARLGVGEFSAFSTGPRGGGGGAGGLWRAQLGSRWHREFQGRTAAEAGGAEFERVVEGRVAHGGWNLTLTGRIDQLVRSAGTLALRELKTVVRTLPTAEAELRAEYPEYFIQLAAYATLLASELSVPSGGKAPFAARAAPTQSGLHTASPLKGDRPEEAYELRNVRSGGFPTEGNAHSDTNGVRLAPELLFVEADTGLTQAVALAPGDYALFREQLGRIVEFLELRRRARDRLRGLQFSPPFAQLRPGQEAVAAELASAAAGGHCAILLEAPTGFGKTGVLLEFALSRLRAGDFDRTIYLTSKATGQIQAMQTLAAMTRPAPAPLDEVGGGRSEVGGVEHLFPVWQVRPKSEHCINHEFHCVRDACPHLDGAETRWPASGLSRFYLFEGQARDLESLRAAGRDAAICPYEITRAALAHNEVWIGDYNYVFAPSNRGLFFEQPGFDPARTLLIVDEAHNLPSRVADAHSHAFTAAEAFAVREAFARARPSAPVALAWEDWAHFLHRLEPSGRLGAELEEEARSILSRLAELIPSAPLDFAALGPEVTELLWRIPSFGQGSGPELSTLWWCPRAGELSLTCLDAAPAIGAALGEFGGVILATATPGPVDSFADSLGLRPNAGDVPGWSGPSPGRFRSAERPAPKAPSAEAAPPSIPPGERFGALTKRETKKLARQVTSGAALLVVEEERAGAALLRLRAETPWRRGAYDVACDLRVDTSYRQRDEYRATTAATVSALGRGASGTVVFFPSYGYAETIVQELASADPDFRARLQPRLSGLAAQAAWIEESLASADALFLVLGSSFAESIDLLGGRVERAMVVGPALPEVNAVQRARLEALASTGRENAFRRVYQIPGMQKVNQALGRLVRAPGQRARVLLHCRRFAEPAYAELLSPDFRPRENVSSAEELTAWLNRAVSKETAAC